MKKLLNLRVSAKSLGRAGLSLGGLMLGILVAIILVLPSAAGSQAAESPSESESPALPGIRTIVTAEVTYASTYKTGYTRNLAELGETPAGTSTSASRAGFIDNDLASGKKKGYIFTYKPGRKDKDGKISDYTLTACPSKWQTMSKSFFTDQTGAIHATTENRAATVKDPEIKERVPMPVMTK